MPVSSLATCLYRGIETGRVVPESILLSTITQVPQSVSILCTSVDYCCTLENEGDGDVRLLRVSNDSQGDPLEFDPGIGLKENATGKEWTTFKEKWVQVCKWVQKGKKDGGAADGREN